MTPMMKQYWQIKSEHKDKIVFFRMGDFYEMFERDAELAAPILNIVLTSRNKKSTQQIKMCGVPKHSIAGPISKLLSAGFKVAICDQVGSATAAKVLVDRKVTRILTPGMVYDPESLDSLTAHYLCAMDDKSASFVDISTGEAFFYYVAHPKEFNHLIHLLCPAELVLTSRQKEKSLEEKTQNTFPISVFDELDLDMDSQLHLPESAWRLLGYIRSSQGSMTIKTIRPFQQKYLKRTMAFTSQALDSMEIFKTYHGELKGSLFYAINRTKTPSGARLLKSRLRQPCTHLPELENRWNQVEHWVARASDMEPIRSLLTTIGDIERRVCKISHAQCSGKDLILLAKSLETSAKVLHLCAKEKQALSIQMAELATMLSSKIQSTIYLDSGNCLHIHKGVSVDLDRLTEEVSIRQGRLNQLEVEEKRKTGISSLKIRYNNIFGYYIEVTKLHSKKVPSYYIRKQTLTQAERYTISELQVLEGQILSSVSKRSEIEKQIFESLRQELLQYVPDLFYLSRILCEIDVAMSCAWLAVERSYIRPCISSDGDLKLVNSRHPALEQRAGVVFVPNTIHLKAGECLMLTGPNMAGKSTLMRQVALSAILAQAGLFVPAEEAYLPIFTQLFTRIGASDNLSQGLSTFMVEMQESAEILKRADSKSLVILDEIGRGTATYDGMSLAQAMLEYLIKEKKSLVFFATHYLELTALSQNLPQVKNAHLSVTENKNVIHFLYTLSKGCAAGSYGVYVAHLAGFPKLVIDRANDLLSERERSTELHPKRLDQELS